MSMSLLNYYTSACRFLALACKEQEMAQHGRYKPASPFVLVKRRRRCFGLTMIFLTYKYQPSINMMYTSSENKIHSSKTIKMINVK